VERKAILPRAAPHKEQEDKEADSEPPLAGMTLAEYHCCATGCGGRKVHEWYEVCLDNGSQVNNIDARLLTNLRTEHQRYRSMNGIVETKRVCQLDGFFDCQACEDCLANIISMADVEDCYPITYVQGDSIVVHMEERDVVFTHRNKILADFSDWIVDREAQLREMYEGLSPMTTEDKRENVHQETGT
jgi:hypothetical protein